MGQSEGWQRKVSSGGHHGWILITVGDFGLNHTSTEIKNFLWSNIISPKDNFFLIIACFFLILGLILKIIYYFIAKHYFCSWDGIKVTFF